jgi:hypothetical protein
MTPGLFLVHCAVVIEPTTLRLRLPLCSRAPAGRGMRAAATKTDRRGAGLFRPRRSVTLTVARAFLGCALSPAHELKAPGDCPGALSYNRLLGAGQKRGPAGAPHQLKR